MDFLTQQEITGFKQDVKHGEAKQVAEKSEFEKKLLGEFGKEMKEELEHPDKKKNAEFAKNYAKKKKRAIWKENLKRIFSKNE